MNCRQTQDFIDGYVDGELDLPHSVELERHLGECADCTRARDARLALREAFRSPSANLYHRAPIALDRIVRDAAAVDRLRPLRPWIVSVVGIAAVVTLSLSLLPRLMTTRRDDQLLNELVSAHVRSTLADHLMDVASTDQHTVKPWFEGKLNYAPPVQDLAAKGFELIGGRLDYLDGRPVAALVYRHQKHVINVFVWPDPERSTVQSPFADVRQGFNIVRWRQGGMCGTAVSDLNATELTELARLIAAGP